MTSPFRLMSAFVVAEKEKLVRLSEWGRHRPAGSVREKAMHLALKGKKPAPQACPKGGQEASVKIRFSVTAR
jgi:hypothetical protein